MLGLYRPRGLRYVHATNSRHPYAGAKPTSTATFPVAADGSFSITNWATPNTNDLACEGFTVIALAPGKGAPPSLGTAAAPTAGALAFAAISRAAAVPGPAPLPTPSPTPATVPLPGSGGLPIINFAAPPLGSNAQFSGFVSNGPPGGFTAGYKIGVLVDGAPGIWWDKTHGELTCIVAGVNKIRRR